MATKRDVLEKLKFNPAEYEFDELLDLIHKGKHLDILVKHEDPDIRYEVACTGHGHDILYKDVDWEIRQVVAEHENFLDELIFDEDEEVRQTAFSSLIAIKRAGDITGIKLLKKEEK